MAQSFLLIDDNPDDRTFIARELQRAFPDCVAEHVVDLPSFQDWLNRGGFELAITDYQLRWSTGVDVLRAVKAKYPDCPVIMFTGTGNEEIAVEAMKMGLDDYIVKRQSAFVRVPISVRLVLERGEAQREVRSLMGSLRSLASELHESKLVSQKRADELKRIADAVTARELRMAQLKSENARLAAQVQELTGGRTG